MRRTLMTVVLAVAASAVALSRTEGPQPSGGKSVPELTPALAQAQHPAVRVGEAAPEIKLERLLQAPLGATAEPNNLRDKVVVLEFWATWCLPCVPAIRHLNVLANQFKGQPVQFIAVTDEDDESRINQYLKEIPISGWIGLDTAGSVFKAYKVGARPHTVVVDRNGKIAAITYPQNVSADAVADLLAGKSISLPLKPSAVDAGGAAAEAEGQSKPLFKIVIESSPTGGGLLQQPGRIEADGIVPLWAIGAAYRISTYRIISTLPLSQGFYRITARVPPGQEERLYPALQQALEMAFGLKVRRESREMDVLVLSGARGQAAALRPSQSTERFGMTARGVIRAKKQPIRKLADLLEEAFLYQPVVDETGLREEYDWDLPYNRVSNNVLLNAIRDKLGLELFKARRTIEVLVVESAAPAGR